LDTAKIPRVTSRYYELMGIDPWTRQPKREELEELELKDVTDMLDKLEEKAVIPEEAPENASPSESPNRETRTSQKPTSSR
jgi:hypothetical protein